MSYYSLKFSERAHMRERARLFGKYIRCNFPQMYNTIDQIFCNFILRQFLVVLDMLTGFIEGIEGQENMLAFTTIKNVEIQTDKLEEEAVVPSEVINEDNLRDSDQVLFRTDEAIFLDDPGKENNQMVLFSADAHKQDIRSSSTLTSLSNDSKISDVLHDKLLHFTDDQELLETSMNMTIIDLPVNIQSCTNDDFLQGRRINKIGVGGSGAEAIDLSDSDSDNDINNNDINNDDTNRFIETTYDVPAVNKIKIPVEKKNGKLHINIKRS